jgi:hypothetical protein
MPPKRQTPSAMFEVDPMLEGVRVNELRNVLPVRNGEPALASSPHERAGARQPAASGALQITTRRVHPVWVRRQP